MQHILQKNGGTCPRLSFHPRILLPPCPIPVFFLDILAICRPSLQSERPVPDIFE